MNKAQSLSEDVRLNEEISRVERLADYQTLIVFTLFLAVLVLGGIAIRQHGELTMLRDHNTALSQIVNDLQSRGGGK